MFKWRTLNSLAYVAFFNYPTSDWWNNFRSPIHWSNAFGRMKNRYYFFQPIISEANRRSFFAFDDSSAAFLMLHLYT